MVIYVDVLIFTNMLVNYCILDTAKKFLHIKSNTLRMVSASFIGALFSLVVFLPIYNGFSSYILRFIISCIICFIAFFSKELRIYIKSVIATFIFSVIFSGMMILLYQIVTPKNMAIINDTVYFQINPLCLIAISVLIYLLILLLQKLFHNEVSNTIARVKFVIYNKEYECIGKIDTGCSVVEPFSGTPVIIVESTVIDTETSRARIIPYKALGYDGVLKGIKSEKTEIDKKVVDKDVYIAIFNGTIDPNIKAIINYEILR